MYEDELEALFEEDSGQTPEELTLTKAILRPSKSLGMIQKSEDWVLHEAEKP